MPKPTKQSGYEPDEFGGAAIEAGVEVLRRYFGGETEDGNRFVDFRAVVCDLWQIAPARASGD